MRAILPSLRDRLRIGRVPTSARPVSRRQMRRDERRLRGRRIKAILSGGLVFGVGATATVAAWTDTEEASGSFEAGRFNIELSVDGTDWKNTSTMTFNAGSMYPGQKVYAPVFVRTTANTSVGGTLAVSGGGADPQNAFSSALNYRSATRSMPSPSDFVCNEANFPGSGDYVFGNGSTGVALNSSPTAQTTQKLDSAAASVQAYCFEVTLPTNAPNAAQGLSTSHTWTFNAESTTPGS